MGHKVGHLSSSLPSLQSILLSQISVESKQLLLSLHITLYGDNTHSIGVVAFVVDVCVVDGDVDDDVDEDVDDDDVDGDDVDGNDVDGDDVDEDVVDDDFTVVVVVSFDVDGCLVDPVVDVVGRLVVVVVVGVAVVVGQLNSSSSPGQSASPSHTILKSGYFHVYPIFKLFLNNDINTFIHII